MRLLAIGPCALAGSCPTKGDVAMRLASIPLMLALSLLLAPSAVSGSGTISSADCSVTINEYGVFTVVPDDGLRTVDGPAIRLAGRCAEWFGLSFNDATGPVEAVGGGNAIDWAR